jgi:hypothetical protein
VLRGALLDLLATGDVARTTAAVQAHFSHVSATTSLRRNSDATTAAHAGARHNALQLRIQVCFRRLGVCDLVGQGIFGRLRGFDTRVSFP